MTPRKNRCEKGLLINVDPNSPVKVSISDAEIYDVKVEFVWFFTGQNNAKPLLVERNYKYLDRLYDRYKSEIAKMRDYYGLDEIIHTAEYAQGWFRDWKKMELFSKEQFLEKNKLSQDFAMIWADLGVTDSLELRNWGLTIHYDANDDASVKNAGKDQLSVLINSIISDPENGIHCITLFNPSNKEERTMPLSLLTSQFVCNKMNYEERVWWFFTNFYESGMEYEILLENFRKDDLDKLKWYDEFITIPKYSLSSHSTYTEIKSEKELESHIVFNMMFLQTMSQILGMVPSNLSLFSPKANGIKKTRKKDDLSIQIKIDKSKGINISNENITFKRAKGE